MPKISERHPGILWAARESLTSMFKDTVFSNASTVLKITSHPATFPYPRRFHIPFVAFMKASLHTQTVVLS